MKFNADGFSMVMAMVVLGGVVASGLYYMTEQQTAGKLSSKVKVNQVVDSAALTVKVALSSIANCNATISARNIPLGSSVPDIIQASDGAKIIEIGQVHDEYTIQEINLFTESVQTSGGPVMQDFLAVIYNIDPNGIKKMFGAATIGRKFRIKGQKTGLQYTNCWHEEGDFVEEAMATACIQLGGNWVAGTFTCNSVLGPYLDPTPVHCVSPQQYQFVIVGGKIKLACI